MVGTIRYQLSPNIELYNITKEGLFEGEGSLAFEAPQNDGYILYLRNTQQYSNRNDKQILIKVYYYFYDYIFLMPGIPIAVLGMILALHYQQKNRVAR